MSKDQNKNVDVLEKLKSNPSINEFYQILKSLANKTLLETESNGKQFLSAPTITVDQLSIYSTLLNQNIPDLYHDLPNKTLALLHQYMLSVSAIGALIGRISTLSKTQNCNLDKTVGSHLDLLATVISNILLSAGQDTIDILWKNISLGHFSESQKRLYHKTLISLFAGGKILSTMAEARLAFQQMERRYIPISDFDLEKWEWLTIGEQWMNYLSHQLMYKISRCGTIDKETPLVTEFFKKMLSLGNSAVFFKVILKEEFIEGLVQLISRFSTLELQQFLISHLLPFLQTQKLELGAYNSPEINDRVNAIANVISYFVKPENMKIHTALLKQAESVGINLELKRAIILVCCRNDKTKEDLFKELLTKWGSDITIKHSPVLVQEAQTQLLILFIPHLTTCYLTSISNDANVYLRGISNHLESFSAGPRLYGMVIGEIISEKAERIVKPLNFDIDSKSQQNEEYNRLKSELLHLNDRYQLIPIGEALSILDTLPIDLKENQNLSNSGEENSEGEDSDSQRGSYPKIVEISETNDDLDLEKLKNISLIYNNDDSDDDEEFEPYAFPENDDVDSDDDDDPSITKKKLITAPVYIPSMIEYLNDTESYEKQKVALESAPALIIRKALFGQELLFYAKSLGACLAMLKDPFEIENFQVLRLRALIALVSSCPKIAPEYFAELIVTGDLTLQDRMTLLSAISLGARALSGENDDVSAQPKVEFASKKLPEQLHALLVTDSDVYTKNSNEVDIITKQLQRRLLKDTVEDAKDHEILSGPRILRMSSKLQKARDGKVNLQTRYTKNEYAKLAGRNFFFPLTGRWWSIGGRKAFAQYSEMFQAHYVKTLAILLHAAYPSSLELPEMTSEILDIVLSQRSVQETQVIESLITSILVVLEILEPEFLVKRYSKELVELRNWLEDTWESIIDERVKGMAAGTLYKIVHITERWERLLVEEFMGLEYTN